MTGSALQNVLATRGTLRLAAIVVASLTLLAAACTSEDAADRVPVEDGGPIFIYPPGHARFGAVFEAELDRCAAESPTLDIMLGPLRRSERPLTVRRDTSVLFSAPYDSGFEPVLRIDLRDFRIFPDGDTLRRRLEESDGPGYIFPHTPLCAALAHRVFEAIVYRRDHARTRPASREAAERLRKAASLETVFVENDVAFDYGHRVEPGGYRVDRVGHCRPEDDEIHVIIERHSEIIHHHRARADSLSGRYNTGRGACVAAVTGRPIESWVNEHPR